MFIYENPENPSPAVTFFYVFLIKEPIYYSRLQIISEDALDTCVVNDCWDVVADDNRIDWSDENTSEFCSDPLIVGYLEISGVAPNYEVGRDLVRKNGILDDMAHAYGLVPYDGGVDH